MSLYAFGLLMAAGGADAGGAGPDGPPTDASLYNYDVDKIGIQWTPGDDEAATQIGFSETSGDSDPAVQATLTAGATAYETGSTDNTFWYLRHIKNRLVSAWVEVDEEVRL